MKISGKLIEFLKIILWGNPGPETQNYFFTYLDPSFKS